MKKIIVTTLLFFVFALSAYAQIKVVNVSAGTGSAAYFGNVTSFSFSEPVKLIVDISGVPVLVAEENANRKIYLWGFIQGCCGSGRNGDWTNSNEANVMTKEATNKWSITLPSVKEFMQASYKQAKDAAVSSNRPANETRFGFLVKGKDGTGDIKSQDMEIPFTGPVFSPSVFTAFPANFAQGDVVTFTFDKNLENNAALKALNEFYIYMEADVKVGANTTVRIPVTAANVGNTPSLKMTEAGGTKFTFVGIPSRYFTLAAGETITEIRVVIQSRTDANVNSGIKKNPVFIAK